MPEPTDPTPEQRETLAEHARTVDTALRTQAHTTDPGTYWPDPHRVDQIRAAIDVLVSGSYDDQDGLEALAAELVDAVNAAAGPVVLTPKLTDEQAEEIEQRFRDTMASGRITVLPREPIGYRVRAGGYVFAPEDVEVIYRGAEATVEPSESPDPHRGTSEPRSAASDERQPLTRGSQAEAEPLYAWEVDHIIENLVRERDQAEARVWQQAIDTLLDSERYLTWRHQQPPGHHFVGTGDARHLADYLTAVGPATVAAAFEAHTDEALAIAEQALDAQAEVLDTNPPCANPHYAHGPHQWAELRDCPGWPNAPAQTAADGTDGAGWDAGNGAEETGGNGTEDGHGCPCCGEPVTGMRSEVLGERATDRRRVVSRYARTYEPCGCTETIDVRAQGDEHG